MPRHTPIYAPLKGSTVYLRNGAAAHAAPALRRRPKRLLRWITLLALLGLLAVGIQNAYPALTGSDFFRMKQIKVVGNQMLPADNVVVASGLTIGGNLFECDLASATKRLEQHPMIDRALLIREPPETLVISMVERRPVALVSTPKGLLGLDAEGNAFPLPSVSLDMPVVTGARPDSTGALAPLATFLNVLKTATPDFWREVSEVRVDGRNSATVYLVGDGLPLRMKFENPEQQVRNFRAYTSAAPGAIGDLAYVDLRFKDQVVVGRR